MLQDDYSSDRITERIIECVIKVHQCLGPGFIERVYHNALVVELNASGLQTASERDIVIYYNDVVVGTHRLDLVIEDSVIVELKAVEELSKHHYAQVRSYLRASKLKTALLVNFAKERADFRRINCN